MEHKILHPNFVILPCGPISKAFIQRNIGSFFEACVFIGNLTYARNRDKNNLLSLFEEHCGTCSTKHALLKSLADENNFKKLQLMVGVYKMNHINTPKIKHVIESYNLSYLPEAHCYLKYENIVFDYTTGHVNSINFINDLIFETEIEAIQIADYKIALHKKYLEVWLLENPELNYNLNDIWKVREQCINALST